MKIEIIGYKDALQSSLYKAVKKAIIKKRIIAGIEIIPESKKPANYYHSATPALYINGTLICSGMVPQAAVLEDAL
ncbi:MAG: hypothetical protein A2096_17235 [Spirochaetes bacterium GWF1_41_5]|nr:MAG: hypothetical protein A2096_17235 [Spirochaetes bacterium GWF1_41_5]HBE03143.1 hypothetical protein [Spirochaetia bacterium]